MGKKQKKVGNSYKEVNMQQEEIQNERWMLRLKTGAIFLTLWVIVLIWVSTNLPAPDRVAVTYPVNKLLWFINIGLAIMFTLIMVAVGKSSNVHSEALE